MWNGCSFGLIVNKNTYIQVSQSGKKKDVTQKINFLKEMVTVDSIFY